MICKVCKTDHYYGEPDKKLTLTYIKQEHKKELAQGGNGTTTALRLSSNGIYKADYYHVIHAVNEINRKKETNHE